MTVGELVSGVFYMLRDTYALNFRGVFYALNFAQD